MPMGCGTVFGAVCSPQAWCAASLPCSMDVAARAGKPMTSPTA